jgi:hypothetical protein
MADKVNMQLECALDSSVSITEKSGNLRNDFKRGIIYSGSTLRSIFVVMKNSVEEHKGKNTQLESDVMYVKVLLQEFKPVPVTARVLPSVGGTGKHPDTSLRQEQPHTGGARNFYSEVTSAKIEKR